MKNGKYIDISSVEFDILRTDLSVEKTKEEKRNKYSGGTSIDCIPGDVLWPISEYMPRGEIYKLKMNKQMGYEIDKRYNEIYNISGISLSNKLKILEKLWKEQDVLILCIQQWGNLILNYLM